MAESCPCPRCPPGPWPRAGAARCPPGRGQTSVPLQSGSASRRRMPSQRQTPRRAPSHPCSASGNPAGLSLTTSPGRGVTLSPLLLGFAGAGPAAFQSRPPATPTQPTSSSRGSPTRGCRPPAKPTTSSWRAQPGTSGAGAPSGHGSLRPQGRSGGAAGPVVCRGARPVGARSAPPAQAGRRDPNRLSWRGTHRGWATAR